MAAGDLAHPHAWQLLLRDGAVPSAGQTERELNRAAGYGTHRKKQLGVGWRNDVLHAGGKIRGDEPLTWERLTGEDKQMHQDLLQHPVMLQSSVRLAPTPQAPCAAANPRKLMCQASKRSR